MSRRTRCTCSTARRRRRFPSWDERSTHPIPGGRSSPAAAPISARSRWASSAGSQRAPYFSNGSAKDLRELVDYYDRRFDMRQSGQEKQDLVNFLGVL
jgi:hypothetical protein